MADELLFEIEDGVALITFNRPESKNTFTGSMMAALGKRIGHAMRMTMCELWC